MPQDTMPGGAPEGPQRLITIGVLLWRDHLLVAPSTIPGDPPGWRCLGGSVRLGERGADAIMREFIEETGRRVEVVKTLPAIEHIREHRGQIGHEVVLPFRVQWRDGYEPDDLRPIACVEDDGSRFEARWMPLDEVFDDASTVHPAGFAPWLKAYLAQPSAPEAPPPIRQPRLDLRRRLADEAPPRGTRRLLALGVLIWRDHLLVAPATPPPGGGQAWRCLGGSVELGERAAEAVKREFIEETGRRVDILEVWPVIENIFEVGGVIGHEAVFPFRLTWRDGYEPDGLAPIPCIEHDGTRFDARWMPLAEVLAEAHTIYPAGFPTWLGDRL